MKKVNNMQIHIVTRGKSSKTITLDAKSTLGDLKKHYSKVCKISIARQCFKTEKNEVLNNDDTVLMDNMTLLFKDFGPQIGYRTVFLWEYFGPLAFVLLYATRPSWIYGPGAASAKWNPVACLGIAAWTFHFLKRELETIFVHRFSRPTMPLFNLFKNSIYYWSFGVAVGYPLCHPDYTAPGSSQVLFGFLLFVIAEVCNGWVHIQFRNMRVAEGSTLRPIPTGVLFTYVSCPNYTFEVLAWVAFSMMTQIAASYVFTLVGLFQMTDWAMKKHKGYLKTYGKEYKELRRTSIIPFVV